MRKKERVIDHDNEQARSECIGQVRALLGALESPKNQYQTFALHKTAEYIENEINYLNENTK